MIYNYLLERGYTHSAFVLSKEASQIKPDLLEYNSLINLITKGKIYEKLEQENIRDLSLEL